MKKSNHTGTPTLRFYFLILTIVMLGTFFQMLFAQNVGIGLGNPIYPLHVAGTIKTNENLIASGTGWIAGKVTIGEVVPNDEYKLRVIGGKTWTSILTAGGAGWEGKMLSVHGDAKFSGGLEMNGTLSGVTTAQAQNLQLSNDGIVEGNFRVNGRIGANGATNSNYGLIVNSSNSYFQGNTTTTGNALVQGSLNVTGDGIIESNFRVNGRIGINGATNANYGLIVNNSNSYFQGNVTATGTVSAPGNLIIKGNGHVRSNGPSNLRVGFNSKYVNLSINNGASVSVLANITTFTGGNDDVRVFVSQVVNDNGSVPWSEVKVTVMGVNSTDNTCLLWLHNTSGANGILKGTIYLTTIAKD